MFWCQIYPEMTSQQFFEKIWFWLIMFMYYWITQHCDYDVARGSMVPRYLMFNVCVT
jgi:hypothetical protein